MRKSFDGHDVLRGIDLVVEQGEVVALIGASGSGKSTLLRTINLLERVDDGQIWLSGLDITDPRVNADLIRARIGVVFQQYNLFPHMTVLENVTIAMRHVQGRTRRDADAAGLELLDRVGLRSQGRRSSRPALRRAAAAGGDRPRDRDEPGGAPAR